MLSPPAGPGARPRRPPPGTRAAGCRRSWRWASGAGRIFCFIPDVPSDERRPSLFAQRCRARIGQTNKPETPTTR